MLFGAFRKTIGIVLLALGIGILLSLFLPVWGWIIIVSSALIFLGISWFLC